MSVTKILFFMGLLIFAMNGAEAEEKQLKSKADCTKDSDCGPGRCCTISNQRSSTPTCNALRKKDESCRPGGPELFSGPLSFLNGETVNVNNIYKENCPCASGCNNKGFCN